MSHQKNYGVYKTVRIARRGENIAVGDQLRLCRKARKMTLIEAAALLDISPSSLGMYERNQRNPDMNTLIKLATLYDQPVHHFSSHLSEERHPLMETFDTELAFQSIQEERWAVEAKERSNYCCELCEHFAPFITPEGVPYLETWNVSAPYTATSASDLAVVCPNCHSKLQLLALDEDIQSLKDRIRSTVS